MFVDEEDVSMSPCVSEIRASDFSLEYLKKKSIYQIVHYLVVMYNGMMHN